MPNPRYNRGRKQLLKLHNQFGAPLLKELSDIAPDFVRHVYEFAFGDIYDRPGLDLKTRQFCTLAMLAARNDSPIELKAHIHGALAIGWTQKQIVELFMQVAVYAGFPAAMNALFIAKEAFAERQRKRPRGGSARTAKAFRSASRSK